MSTCRIRYEEFFGDTNQKSPFRNVDSQLSLMVPHQRPFWQDASWRNCRWPPGTTSKYCLGTLHWFLCWFIEWGFYTRRSNAFAARCLSTVLNFTPRKGVSNHRTFLGAIPEELQVAQQLLSLSNRDGVVTWSSLKSWYWPASVWNQHHSHMFIRFLCSYKTQGAIHCINSQSPWPTNPSYLLQAFPTALASR
jgi:hypothetical protein